jgi:putative SOS response-associated peptidase YedK
VRSVHIESASGGYRRAVRGSVPEAYQHRFNLAPQQQALIVRERDGERDAVMATWGLLPHWAKDSKIAFKMINARAEPLTEKPAYRSLLSRHRCLIPADGFYEWTVGSGGRVKRTPAGSPRGQAGGACEQAALPASPIARAIFELG